jgi:hypothetical protein
LVYRQWGRVALLFATQLNTDSLPLELRTTTGARCCSTVAATAGLRMARLAEREPSMQLPGLNPWISRLQGNRLRCPEVRCTQLFRLINRYAQDTTLTLKLLTCPSSARVSPVRGCCPAWCLTEQVYLTNPHQHSYQSKDRCFPCTQWYCGVSGWLRQADGVTVCVCCKASDHML